jgi:hypothetical protein
MNRRRPSKKFGVDRIVATCAASCVLGCIGAYLASQLSDATWNAIAFGTASAAISVALCVMAVRIEKILYASTKELGGGTVTTVERKPRIVRPLGSRLYALAEFLYCRKTMERVFDPMIVDAREEYHAALAQDRKWKALWVQISYYWAFAKVLPLRTIVELGQQVVKFFSSAV